MREKGIERERDRMEAEMERLASHQVSEGTERIRYIIIHFKNLPIY